MGKWTAHDETALSRADSEAEDSIYLYNAD